jgi:hypothetical protein
MFCTQCISTATTGAHQYECNNRKQIVSTINKFVNDMIIKCLTVFDWNVEDFKKFWEANKQTVTVFDLDFSDRNDSMYEKNMIRVMLTQAIRFNIYPRAAVLIDSLIQHPMLKKLWNSHEKFFHKLAMRLMEVACGTERHAFYSKRVNIEECVEEIYSKNPGSFNECFDVKIEFLGLTLHPFYDMLRHSCDQNTQCLIVSNKLVTYACKPIKKGSEIFKTLSYSFAQSGPAAERKRRYSIFGIFNCDCEACINDWPTIPGMRFVDPFFQYPVVRVFASHDQAKKNIARNNEYVDRNFKAHEPIQEVYITIENNHIELFGLARPSFYP